ncbi:hypothetical protein V9T40_011503 [Parthenolecanium corni]|uniref:Uncharacterized protein n=1 Tax=Parthenolecanium corni TaxID=536013 RepID=A0AAN9TIV2_9HEMI
MWRCVEVRGCGHLVNHTFTQQRPENGYIIGWSLNVGKYVAMGRREGLQKAVIPPLIEEGLFVDRAWQISLIERCSTLPDCG